jgi:hypothetical protein
MSHSAAEKLPQEGEESKSQSPEDKSRDKVFDEKPNLIEVNQAAREMEGLRAKELATDDDRSKFVKFSKMLATSRFGKWVKVAMGVLILGGSMGDQQPGAKAFKLSKPAGVTNNLSAEPQPDENELFKLQEDLDLKQIEEQVYDLFQTEEMVNAGIAGKLTNEILTSIKERTQLGETLISIDGVMWTWQDADGNETTSVIDTIEENKDHLNAEAQQAVAEYEEQQAQEKQDVEKQKQEQRRIDLAGEKISILYQEILEENNYENVLPLDNENIDRYLQSGYYLVLPLYDGVGKNMLGFVMKNYSVNDKVVFELVVDEPVAQEEAPAVEMEKEASAPEALIPKDLHVRLAEAKRVSELTEGYFPEEQESLMDLGVALLDNSEVTAEEYKVHSSELAAVRHDAIKGMPELQEVNQRIDDGVAGLAQMFKDGASMEARQEYIISLDLDEQLGELKQDVARGTPGEAALNLLGGALSVELDTAFMWEKASE